MAQNREVENGMALHLAVDSSERMVELLPDGGFAIAARLHVTPDGGSLAGTVTAAASDHGVEVAVSLPPAVVSAAADGGEAAIAILGTSSQAMRDAMATARRTGPPGGLAESGVASVEQRVRATVSLRLFSGSGQPSTVGAALPEPVRLLFQLPSATELSNLVCAFWDEEREEWSTDGVREVPPGEGEEDVRVCETDHLTVFGLIEEVSIFISCSRVGVFAADSFERVMQSETWSKPPAFCFMGTMVFFVVVLIWSKWKDRREFHQIGWNDELLLTEHASFQLDRGPSDVSTTASSKSVASSWAFSETSSTGGPLKRIVMYTVQSSRVHSARLVQSVSSGMCATDSGFLMRAYRFESTKAELEHSGGQKPFSTNDFAVERGRLLYQKAHDGTQTFMKTMSNSRKIWTLVQAIHPLADLNLFSITQTRSMRTVVLFAKVFGSFMASALILESIVPNSAPLEDLDPECAVESSEETWARNVVVGALASMASLIPVIVLRQALQRRFVLVKSHDETTKRRQLFLWACSDAAFWIGGFSYVAFADLVVVLFLASVNGETALRWLVAAAVALMWVFCVMPLVVTFTLLALTNLALGCCGWHDDMVAVNDYVFDKVCFCGKGFAGKVGKVISGALEVDALMLGTAGTATLNGKGANKDSASEERNKNVAAHDMFVTPVPTVDLEVEALPPGASDFTTKLFAQSPADASRDGPLAKQADGNADEGNTYALRSIAVTETCGETDWLGFGATCFCWSKRPPGVTGSVEVID